MKFRLAIVFFLSFFSSGLLALDFIRNQHVQNQQQNESKAMSDKFESKYPVVLHHGLFGFRKILFLEYFHQVPDYLREAGYEVFVTRVYPLGNIERRSRELAEQIDEILRITGSEKVNIIGHSMGGLDARYLVSSLGFEDKVASVSMIGTPNQGSYFADVAAGIIGGVSSAKNWMLNLIGLDSDEDGIIEQAMDAVYNCSEDFIQNHFNLTIRNSDSVYYQSWAGTASVTGIGTGDILSPVFLIPFSVVSLKDGENDGLVSVRSAKWGHYRGPIPADHLDQIGFVLTESTGFSNFRHKRFYQLVASGLSRKGF